jgi:hypothetical protein
MIITTLASQSSLLAFWHRMELRLLGSHIHKHTTHTHTQVELGGCIELTFNLEAYNYMQVSPPSPTLAFPPPCPPLSPPLPPSLPQSYNYMQVSPSRPPSTHTGHVSAGRGGAGLHSSIASSRARAAPTGAPRRPQMLTYADGRWRMRMLTCADVC